MISFAMVRKFASDNILPDAVGNITFFRTDPTVIGQFDDFEGAGAVINATSAGLSGAGALDVPLAATPATAVVMDMVYKPLHTPFLRAAEALGRPTVDGLAMLLGQAVPSFEAFFGVPPPAGVDVRALALETLGDVERT